MLPGPLDAIWPELSHQQVLVTSDDKQQVNENIEMCKTGTSFASQLNPVRCRCLSLTTLFTLPASSLLELIFLSDRVHRRGRLPRPSVYNEDEKRDIFYPFSPKAPRFWCGNYQRSVNFRKQLSPV